MTETFYYFYGVALLFLAFAFIATSISVRWLWLSMNRRLTKIESEFSFLLIHVRNLEKRVRTGGSK
ncbi:hypothetical protein [Ochrobactrum sp. SFR4]|uniref:hypothetical protein n=1 Tax=Ochrobactrum sp. SFR4 TaxID=2717368 RepID=UPI001C8B4986|nr:hypothetical protein [Ochrobactrum sp. SFR4]MBX8811106.1 hypothetical protein [Ochrobactrum sp. MR34]MBX8826527.1 hypothetical protein [Ochrobactrum sp. SFR4]